MRLDPSHDGRIIVLHDLAVRRLGPRLLAMQSVHGAQVSVDHVHDLLHCFHVLAKGDWFVLLVDKRTRYSISFPAQHRLFAAGGLAAVAILFSANVQEPAMFTLLEVGRRSLTIPLEHFFAPKPAIRWLRSIVKRREQPEAPVETH